MPDDEKPPFFTDEEWETARQPKIGVDPWTGETVGRSVEVVHIPLSELTGDPYDLEEDEPYHKFEKSAEDKPVRIPRPWDDEPYHESPVRRPRPWD